MAAPMTAPTIALFIFILIRVKSRRIRTAIAVDTARRVGPLCAASVCEALT